MILAVLLLGGCGAKPAHVVTRIQLVEPRIPPMLLSCPAAPAVPAAPSARQSQVATYVAQLWRAHQICHDHLAAVARAIQALASNGAQVVADQARH